MRNLCRLCENSAQHLQGRIFFHVSYGKWLKSESKCPYLTFFGRFLCLTLKSASFHTICLGCELPLDLRSGGVAPFLPACDLALEGVLMGGAARQALARKDAQLNFSYVEPGAVLRCVMDLKAVG